MKKYRIEVGLRIEEVSATEVIGLKELAPGHVQAVIAENEAVNISGVERVVLALGFEAFRRVLSKHLTEASKDKALDQGLDGELVVNDAPYRVDGEVGRFEFMTHRIVQDGKSIYDTSKEVFPIRHGCEWHQTVGFKEIVIGYGVTERSYRKTNGMINRIRHQDNATPCKTISDQTKSEGMAVANHMEHKANKILTESGFSEDLGFKCNFSNNPILFSEVEVKEVMKKCEIDSELETEIIRRPHLYERKEHTVNISIDDVGSKRQKENRNGKVDIQSDCKKYVHTTVAHIEKEGKSYVIVGHGVSKVLRIVLAFILNNGLLGKRFMFFVDGQRSLQATVIKMFCWYRNMSIILDWYHLAEKCKMQLSLAMKGRKVRNEVLESILPLLWHGLVDKAKEYLAGLDKRLIKDAKAIEQLVGYFERNRAHIPCYALRKGLGLRNSSNIGEKANDLIVADRQKHNGMSWSETGYFCTSPRKGGLVD